MLSICKVCTKCVITYCAIRRSVQCFIDKSRTMDNNVITLIKYLIKDINKRRKNDVTAGNDKARRNYFQRGTGSGTKR